MTTAKPVAEGFSLLEGPRWHDGLLYFSDFYTHQVLTLDDSDSVEVVCEVPGQPSGLGFSPEGELLVVSMLDQRLLRLDGSELVVVADLGPYCGGPANDLVVTKGGRAYVGNFGLIHEDGTGVTPTNIVTVGPDGSVAAAAEGVVFPNGMVLLDDESRLVVAETFVGRLTDFHIAPDGSLQSPRTWAEFSPYPDVLDIAWATQNLAALPDGLVANVNGHVWVADAKGHGATLVEKGGAVVDFVDTGDLSAYAVALGGADMRDLYLCCAPPLLTSDPTSSRESVLMRSRVGTPGVPSG